MVIAYSVIFAATTYL